MPHSSSTTYALPSDVRAGNGGALSAEEAKARRVQEQIKLRMAEKSTLPRQNGKGSHYPMSDYGGSSSMKYSTYGPGGFTSKSSYMYNGSRTIDPRISQRADFSSRSSGPAIAQFQRMSVGGGVAGGGGGFYTEDVYQGGLRQHNRIEPDAVSVHSMQQMAGGANWMYNDEDARSSISERNSPMNHQLTQSAVNDYGTQMRQSTITQMGPMHQSLRGINYPNGGMSGGGAQYIQQQHSYKGPSLRTINKKTNRNRMSVGSMSGNLMSSSASSFGRDKTDGGFIAQGNSQGSLMRQAPLSRAMSTKSMQSVGRGADIFYAGQMELGASTTTINQALEMDIQTAVEYIRSKETEHQKLGAATIQHQCYESNEAKNMVSNLGAICDLVELFNSEDKIVRRYATGAARNVIYQNLKNKEQLIELFGINALIKALEEDDDELHKNITGILWNLSSKDPLKKKIAQDTIPGLTAKILKPLVKKIEVESKMDNNPEVDNKPRKNDNSDDCNGSENFYKAPPDEEIFCNTTGCFRNLSSADAKTRQLMRSQDGLVESLVIYIKTMLDKKKSNNKGVENCVCTLRNLSYELYDELPHTAREALEGESGDSNVNQAIGCFSPQSRKARNRKKNSCLTTPEAAKSPKGMDWLWHPQILDVYHDLLKSKDTNSPTREAAAGALQNVTYGERRWPLVLAEFAEKKQIISTILDLLKTGSDKELRSLTGFLRNLARHTSNKDEMAQKAIRDVVGTLPKEGEQLHSFPVLINICGILNNLVICSSLAAKKIAECEGLAKLKIIRDANDSSEDGLKAIKSAETVIVNMYYYKKLHKLYRQKGFNKDFFKQQFK